MKTSRQIPKLAAGLAVLMLSWAGAANAEFITNGTFNSDISGWTVGGTIPTVWDSGSQTAHVGRPGTPGVSIFSQTFDITAGTTAISYSFDYQWQINKPQNEDTFWAYIEYQQESGRTQQITLRNEGSNSVEGVDFDTTTFFVADTSALVDLKNASDNATIYFQLTETANDNGVGTRIQLDNVSVSAVPLPAAAWLFGSALFGLLAVARRRQATS